jgi:putative FmdB family regulatory protein
MPLFEYVCKTCDGQFEVLVRTATSDPHPACPTCGSAEVDKLLSLVAARPARGRSEEASPLGMSQPRASGGGCCGGACGCGH